MDSKIAAQLEAIFGEDFFSFFYVPYVNERIHTLQEVMGVNWYLPIFDGDYWPEKHPLNFPGPLYTGETDNCGTGRPEAPFNVLYDNDGREYVYRQPANYTELLGVLTAAGIDPFDGYAGNGNDHWTYDACKTWWRNRGDVIVALQDGELRALNEGHEQAYIDYLRSGAAETDLRRYCYFLEHYQYPTNEQVALPDL
ncbi:MAG: hypothetical protein J7623_08625 [Chitinophaga sp.]|uniref:hypothetical protein n=1 Tax=Chitinophaga sp. TaxID=1869181 RepID=UPI001B2BDC6B|nr:hypothetical protein [Chitinophaga sp.]MBO9728687.1 hypothetical protein [Chitinophaga sp.]